MKKIECDVIQDLLPSYNDKISSKATNKLVEEHLQECQNCRNLLKNINKELNDDFTNNQNEEIDYLKGYRRNKIKMIIFAITLTATIIIGIYLLLQVVFPVAFYDTEFYVDIDNINVEYMYRYNDINIENRDTLCCYLYSEKYKQLELSNYYEVIDDNGSKEIHMMIVAKNLIKPIFSREKILYSGLEFYPDLNNNVSKIYIEDKKGKVKEIWNNNMDVMTREEWINWYLDNYVPKEIKDKYEMDYELMYKVHPSTIYYPSTGTWRHLYNINLK